MSNISPHHLIDLPRFARLARLEVTAEEISLFKLQFQNILEQLEKIKNLDLEGVEPTLHGITDSDVFREDLVGESLSQATMLANAPHHANSLFVVPKVLE